MPWDGEPHLNSGNGPEPQMQKEGTGAVSNQRGNSRQTRAR